MLRQPELTKDFASRDVGMIFHVPPIGLPASEEYRSALDSSPRRFQGGFTLDGNGKCSTSHALEAFDRAVGVIRNDPLRFQDTCGTTTRSSTTRRPRTAAPAADVDCDGRQADQAKHLYDLSWFWGTARAGYRPPSRSSRRRRIKTGTRAIEPARRAGVPGAHAEPAPAIARVAEHGGDHCGRRLRRLVRPRHAAHREPVEYAARLHVRDKSDGPGARCGYGPRLPLLVISPYAKENYVSHALTDQTSILRFIEDNWLNGEPGSATSRSDRIAGSLDSTCSTSQHPRMRSALLLDPATGGVNASARTPCPGKAPDRPSRD